MKAENMFIGQRVQVKTDALSYRGFMRTSLGRTGVITHIDLGTGLDVRVEFDGGGADWGYHSGIRKVKEA